MEQQLYELLSRIANAFERQVQQGDEAVARNLEWRNDNLQRHEREQARQIAEQAEQLAEARDTNRKLLEEIGRAIRLNAEHLKKLELLESVGAVGQPPKNPI